jgi:GNAT superfamily N-acetyltransferase
MDVVKSSLGDLQIKKAGPEDAPTVLAIMRDAANWLQKRNIAQWTGMLTDKGPALINQRIKDEVAYVVTLQKEPIGTITVLWDDFFSWGEKGLDGSAGYIHGLAVLRRFAGKQIGRTMLNWAIEIIQAKKLWSAWIAWPRIPGYAGTMRNWALVWWASGPIHPALR